MHYLVCPRCKFRVPANRHLCTTCGKKLPSLNPPGAGNPDKSGAGSKLQKTSFWQQFMGWTSPEQEHKEAGHDGPALGEV